MLLEQFWRGSVDSIAVGWCERGDLQKKKHFALCVCVCLFKCQSQHFFQTDDDFYLLTCADCFPFKGNKTQCHNYNKQLFKQESVHLIFE